MDAQMIRELQAYGFFSLVVIMVFILYGYFFHLYRSEKTGRRNYEKYAKLALDDELGGVVLEQNGNKKGL